MLMFNLWLSIGLNLILFGVIILGIIVCIKSSFMEGIVFFILIIIQQIYIFIFPRILYPLINNWSNLRIFNRISMGEIIALSTYISTSLTTILSIVAYGVLVLGIYKRRHLFNEIKNINKN
ncbi:hypothetical protein EDC18_101497 [Natranaerovirga pectinivora]|uniref:Uncharacterized protein n=1 Tax=Natranaerovirga pectinivora TaxID=682400 RepID=A0A4V2V0P8_9FIRM|nr:hypothetical protein [Natranaerovirga pectinivora]TCT17199.1 hypothetical protein EDC18_101497 [Natranaerovirga pectinivora]